MLQVSFEGARDQSTLFGERPMTDELLGKLKVHYAALVHSLARRCRRRRRCGVRVV